MQSILHENQHSRRRFRESHVAKWELFWQSHSASGRFENWHHARACVRRTSVVRAKLNKLFSSSVKNEMSRISLLKLWKVDLTITYSGHILQFEKHLMEIILYNWVHSGYSFHTLQFCGETFCFVFVSSKLMILFLCYFSI